MKKKKNLAKLNSFMQKVNKVTKKISDANAVSELLFNNNPNPAIKKAKNRFKNELFKKLF